MQVTVNIPDELAAQVKARGLSPENFVNGLIEDASRGNPGTAEHRVRDMEAFFETMAANSEKIPQLPEEAFARESYYRDHD
jgi:hypothetical protein